MDLGVAAEKMEGFSDNLRKIEDLCGPPDPTSQSCVSPACILATRKTRPFSSCRRRSGRCGDLVLLGRRGLTTSGCGGGKPASVLVSSAAISGLIRSCEPRPLSSVCYRRPTGRYTLTSRFTARDPVQTLSGKRRGRGRPDPQCCGARHDRQHNVVRVRLWVGLEISFFRPRS